MDFRLTDEQEMLRDGARRFVVDKLDYAARSKRVVEGGDVWSEFADLGWLMLAIPESAGGLERPLEDVAIVAEELGRGLAIEPFVTGAYLPSRFLAAAESHGGSLEGLATGEVRFATALFETQRRYSLEHRGGATTARFPPRDSKWRLTQFRSTR